MHSWVGMNPAREPYPSDVSHEEPALVAPYLTLLREDAGQREPALREVFNGLRYVVGSGCPWRLMPHDLPPWFAVYQQAQRWLSAGCIEQLAEDLRAVLRMAAGRAPDPSAAVLDSRTLRSSPESGERAGSDGAKRKKGSQLPMAVDTVGHRLARHVMPADADDRGGRPVSQSRAGGHRRERRGRLRLSHARTGSSTRSQSQQLLERHPNRLLRILPRQGPLDIQLARSELGCAVWRPRGPGWSAPPHCAAAPSASRRQSEGFPTDLSIGVSPDRVEVGRVGREVEQPGSHRLDPLADAADRAGWQVVHDDRVAGL